MDSIENNFNEEIKNLFLDLGLEKDENVFITGNIAALGRVRIPKKIKMEVLLDSIFKIIGPYRSFEK